MLIYRVILSLLMPFLLWRERAHWRARWVGPKVDGMVIWLHGASVGELTSARPIIAAMSDQPMLVTCNSTTGLAMLQGWNLPHVKAALAPFDRAAVARRLMRQCRGLIVLENELWPNRITAAFVAHIPVVLLSARMSDRSYATWQRLPGLARRLLSQITLAVPQDATSARNLIALGLPADAVMAPTQLKAAYSPATTTAHPSFDPAVTILAASTHEGEEDLILDAFAIAHKNRPDLRLIIAPRHPARGDDIAALIAHSGLPFTRQSRNETPIAAVHLADTLGMMDTWYASAGLCFVGGSLTDHGGHTPYEPMAHRLPILHGPHVRNFANVYTTLGSAGAAVQVTGPQDLSDKMLQHLNNTEMADLAGETVQAPDISALCDQIRNAIS